jgi:hypothetical protein
MDFANSFFIGGLEIGICSALIILFNIFLLWYFSVKWMREITSRYQLVYLEIGNPEISLLPIKPRIPLHYLNKFFLLLILINVVYRISLIKSLYSLLARLINIPASLIFYPDRPFLLGLFLAVLAISIVLYLTRGEESWRKISILLNTEKDRKADYFIEVDFEKTNESILAVKDLFFNLYGPTVFFLIVNSQLEDKWGDLTRAILQGSKEREEGICSAYTQYALMITPVHSIKKANDLFPNGKIYFIPYSIRKFGDEKIARNALYNVLVKLSRFTYGPKSYASENYMGRFAFDPERLNFCIEENCRYLIPCYPQELAAGEFGTAEFCETIIRTQNFAYFSKESIKQVLVFDVAPNDIVLDEFKRERRQNKIREGIYTALDKKPGEIFVNLKLLRGQRIEPPLFLLVADTVIEEKEGEKIEERSGDSRNSI